MNARTLILLAGLGSAALLIGAWTFEALGYAPCKLCLWQRWPHMAAVAIAALALWRPARALAALGALAAATTAAIGLYHTGVERDWWEGPTSCSGGASLGGLSGGDLLATDGPGRVVMCDQVSWEMLGLSMASWNMLASLVLVGLWLVALRRA